MSHHPPNPKPSSESGGRSPWHTQMCADEFDMRVVCKFESGTVPTLYERRSNTRLQTPTLCDLSNINRDAHGGM